MTAFLLLSYGGEIVPESNSDNYVTRKEFNIERDRVNDSIREIDKKIASLEIICSNLTELPQAITNLDKTMAVMGQNLSNLNKEFERFVSSTNEKDSKQNEMIMEIDEKSKVDFLTWVKNNWTTIILFIITIALSIKQFTR